MYKRQLQAFQILLQIGAGTGLVFILRWFWWRINAWSEISAMVISFGVAVWFSGVGGLWSVPDWSPTRQLVVGVVITTVGWILVTLVTPPADRDRLVSFHRQIRPMGPGWGPVVEDRRAAGDAIGADGKVAGEPVESLSAAALAWLLGCLAVYSAMFGTGYVLYGEMLPGVVLLSVAAAGAVAVLKLMPRVGLR